MTHLHDIVMAPMHVIGDKGSLLIDFVRRISF